MYEVDKKIIKTTLEIIISITILSENKIAQGKKSLRETLRQNEDHSLIRQFQKHIKYIQESYSLYV